ncbi:SIR2 family protein [uncultured Porphyromonas sp.]|uniref:SIR2 family protein n=1 Tax=uncultured Porphyromonas sp. TaxID=159274 RepID=UPI0026025771|nr:SIR2 family protein [uncultured Porphyromonas sp.]
MIDNDKKEYGRSWENVQFTQGGKSPELFQKGKAKYIAQFLRDQLQLKNLSFLFGSGTSTPALPLMADLYREVQECLSTESVYKIKSLFDKVSANASENLEEILGLLYARHSYLEGIKSEMGSQTTKSLIDKIEGCILTRLNQDILAECTREKDSNVDNQSNAPFISTLNVYETFYRTLSLRSKELSRLSVFTTNNDLFNETAMDNTNTMYINGFTSGLKRYFNPSLFHYTYSKRMDSSIDKYEPVDNMVYLYKLHGSVNWVEQDSVGNKFYNIVEIDAKQSVSFGRSERVMIYPTPTKQNKSLGSPYTDIIRAFHHKLLQPNSVLFVCGYSFSDEHLNRIIYQALAANSSLNVVVVNKLDESKEIKQVDDRRIYHLWEEKQDLTKVTNSSELDEEEDTSEVVETTEKTPPIHYFSEFVNLMSEIISQPDDRQELLNKFSNEILNQLQSGK